VFIPLSVDRPRRRPTLVCHVLIGLTVLAHLAVYASILPHSGAASPDMDPAFLDPLRPVVERFGVSWAGLFGEGDRGIGWLRLISYAFLHGGSMHLLGNMLALWVFGPSVEDRFGRVWFTLFYFAGAAAAGLAHVLSEQAPAIGASGAVAAVTGAFLVLFPRTHVKVFVFFFFIGIYEFPALWFIGAAIAMDIFSQSFGDSDVAHMAHLGGYALGSATAVVLLLTKVLAREPQYDLVAIFKHRQRRAELQRAVREAEAANKIRLGGPAPAIDDAAATARAEVLRAFGARDWPAAARASDALATTSAAYGALDRRTLKDLAAGLFGAGCDAQAAAAYLGLLKHYPQDPEIPSASVLLGVLLVRRLGRGGEAVDSLKRAIPLLTDVDERALAEELLREAGAPA